MRRFADLPDPPALEQTHLRSVQAKHEEEDEAQKGARAEEEE
jgi:hypothetical protein